jgi:glycosyltransferase A (GT-A) superfamily protein (DUF2064 family)
MHDPVPAQRPTLLVFTLGAEAEGRRRRLLPEALRDRETALYRACLDEALAAGRACGFRLAVSAPGAGPDAAVDGAPDATLHAQGEGGFGDRLAAAFDAAGPAPGSPVIVVGTDTPGLTADRLRRAALALAEPLAGPPQQAGRPAGRAVIGPSPDGGLYLLAADRPLGELLRRVPWRRRRTLAALTRELERAGFAVHRLDALADLDRPADLDGWLAARRRDAGGGPNPSAAALDRLAATFDLLAAALDRLLAALRRPFVPPSAAAPRPAVVPVRAGRAPPRRPS